MGKRLVQSKNLLQVIKKQPNAEKNKCKGTKNKNYPIFDL
jgi:hypothetical protein